MKLKDIRLKTDSVLRKTLAEKRDELRDLKFKVYSKQFKNHQKLRLIRKDIAQISTVLKEKALLSLKEKNKK